MQLMKITAGTIAGAFAMVAVACGLAVASAPDTDEPAAQTVDRSSGTTGLSVESYIDEHERLLRAQGVEPVDEQASVGASFPAESYIDEHERLLRAVLGEEWDEGKRSRVAAEPMPWYAIEHTILIEGVLASLN